jgi:transposase-like protein
MPRGRPFKKGQSGNPEGRPTDYREEYAEQAHKLCLLLGATDAELAQIFGVNEDTIHEWKKAHPLFSESLTRGKVIADANVAERTYQRALGYSHEAVKIFMPAGASEPVYAPYTEHYPPDTQAASLWLRNRQSGKWRDRVEHTGADGGALVIRWEGLPTND